MIAPDDRVELAPGVTMRGEDIFDAVRGVRVRLNPTAAIALREPTPRDMTRALGARYGVDRSCIDRDARALCTAMNRALLVNVRVATPRLLLRWLSLVLVLAPLSRLPQWPTRRVGVRTTSAAGTLATVARGALGASSAAGTVTALPFVVVNEPIAGFSAGAATALGVVVHEVGHALALRGVTAVLIVRGVRVALLHARLDRRREAFVAAAGPCAVVCAAVVALAASQLVDAEPFAVVACVLGLHAVSLTALAPDGRKICAGC